MESLVKRFCPICGGIVEFLIRRIDKYNYYYCIDCGLIFSNPIPSIKEIVNFYNNFLYRKPKDDEDFSNIISSIISDVKKIVKDISRYKKLSPKLSLLDFGGGTGFYAFSFYINNFDVTLIDIDKGACDYAKNKFFNCFEIINEDVLYTSFNKKFDIIFANQTIEHLIDINLFCTEIKQLLKEDGIAIITTPNQECKEFFFRLYWLYSYLRMTSNKLIPFKSFISFLRRPWICCDPPRHIYSFNERNISMLLKRNGFDIVYVKTEYSTEQYYSGKMYDNWEIKNKRDCMRIIYYMFIHLGIKMLKVLDRKKRWGNNLVVYTKISHA